MSGPWSATVFRENAYMPASRRAQTMVTENRPSFLISKGGSYPGELDIYNTSESRNEFDSESFASRLRVDDERELGHAVSLQSGETEKMTGVFDGLRVDRMALAADAVEIYSDRRD